MVWLALALSVAVWAQSPDNAEQRARELYENGVILYDEGRYEDAIVAWNEAYAMSERPLLLYNIASAQERLGRWQEALDTLNRYRVYAATDERERLDRRIANLERRLAAEGTTTAEVATTPAPAVEGLPTVSETYTTSTARWLAPTTLAVGGTGVLVGTISALRTTAARDEAELLCVSQSDGLLCPASAGALLQQDRIGSVVTDVSFVLGGAGLLGGTALLIWADAPILPTANGLMLQGQF